MSNTVPEGWDNKKLGDAISSVISGQSPNRKDHPAMPGKYGILKTTAIDWGKYSPLINQEVLDDYKVNLKHEVRTGDILITKAGPVHRVGVVAYVEKTPSNMLVSGKMTLLRAQKDHDPRYLSYALATDYSQKPLKESTTGMAASQTNFTHDTLLSIPIWVPGSLPEQQKIAAILSSVDNVIEKTRAQIDKLKDLKTGMMQELLTKGIGHTAFKDSPVGRIPEGWEVQPLSEVFILTSGKAKTKKELSPKSKSTPVPVFGGNGVNGYCEEPLIDYKTVVIGRVGEYCGVVHLSPDRAWITDNALYAKCISEGYNLDFMYYKLCHASLGKLRSKGGQPLVSQGPIYELNLGFPKLDEQVKVSSVLKSLDQKIDAVKHKLTSLISIKKALMQDLLAGKVRVNVENNNMEECVAG